MPFNMVAAQASAWALTFPLTLSTLTTHPATSPDHSQKFLSLRSGLCALPLPATATHVVANRIDADIERS